jgi:hypothetical protein
MSMFRSIHFLYVIFVMVMIYLRINLKLKFLFFPLEDVAAVAIGDEEVEVLVWGILPFTKNPVKS